MVERRDAPRRPIHVPANVSFESVAGEFPCLITNASEGGLQVVIEPLEAFPALDMKNPKTTLKLFSGELVDATLVWREDAAIGLKLVNGDVLTKVLPNLW